MPLRPTCRSVTSPSAKGDDPNAVESQSLEQPGDRLEVPRQPIERLGDDDLESPRAGRLEHGLISRPQLGGATDGGVAVDLNKVPILALDSLLA